ncbi:MAG: carbamoyl-phosphate synthase large subunit [Canidatus Methanoxibalbensis ujae]|nr:carbamoyl-phosphate synthase large subunit [Candidatus Methanoxibalbensis ujae]
MPLRGDIRKVLVIGSGPIQIGQAAEFDFSGSQACRALRDEGVKVVLVNSNPATIMTDFEMADVIYIEPLVADVVEKILDKESPDGVIAGLGGQTALNLVVELVERGALEKYGVKVLGTPVEAIYNAEDRERFKNLMHRIGEPVPRSEAVNSVEEALDVAEELGYPLVIRPAYTLGGAGGGIARDEEDLKDIVQRGLNASRIHQVLIEESVLGWKEIEYEVMRDAKDTCITVCNMENLDPMGIHTGESIVVAPSQTLTDEEHQMLRSAALKIIRALKVEGGCNIQFALREGEYRVIEVNPRVSRSSALASKATGYPIARVAAKIALGLSLDEIENRVTGKTPASFEPAIDYVVVKIPRWPFDKFPEADRTLTTSMKSTGEVMAIGRTFEEALQKAIRSLDIDRDFGDDEFAEKKDNEILRLIEWPNDERIFAIYEALRRGISADKISKLSNIDIFFIKKIENIVKIEKELRRYRYEKGSEEEFRKLLKKAKRMGFSDERISRITGMTEDEVREIRRRFCIRPTYKMVDTCAAEFEASTPYYYSTYEEECELHPSERKKVLIIGSGPIRIGQGIEFDYSTVHAVKALREEGIEAHIINNNPETVSTDFDTSDKLFFEPLTLEDVMNVIEKENYEGVIVQFGGQTSVNLAVPLKEHILRMRERGLKTEILGTPPDRIDEAEDRKRFSKLLLSLGIPQPESGYAFSYEEAKEVARRIGYPVFVRPSYVLGGRAMEIVHDEEELERYMKEAVKVSKEKPVLIDKFLENAVEIDVDAVCDCEDVLIGAIMEHIEQAGIHSGDSACVIPPLTLSEKTLNTIREYVKKIAKALNICGLMNVQLAVKDDVVYVLEVNPRASRTVPFVSKATGIPLAKIAAKVMIGKKLRELGVNERRLNHFAVKEVVLPFIKLPHSAPLLGPEMKSTGEVMGIASSFEEAFFKAQLAAENPLPLPSKHTASVFISVCDEDKEKAVEVARKLSEANMRIFATDGTAKFLRERGIKVSTVGKLHEDNQMNIIDMLLEREIQLVINTVRDKYAYKDAHIIRRACVDFRIPYITTMNAANAAADAILRMKEISVKSLNEYLMRSVFQRQSESDFA